MFLGMMAAAIAALQTTSARLRSRAFDDLHLRADIDAGLSRAVLGLIDSRPDQHWPVDGTRETFVFEGDPIELEVQDQTGLVDLNAADQATVEKVLQWAGIAGDAQTLAARIVDWRTPLDGNTPDAERTAKDDAYGDAGLNYAPRHAPFQSVDEVRLVLGMTPALYERIAPLLTVYARQPQVDPQAATLAVKTALGLSNSPAQTPGAPIASGTPIVPAAPGTVIAPATPGAASPGRSFAIDVTARHRRKTLSRHIVILFTDNDDKPYLVESWR